MEDLKEKYNQIVPEMVEELDYKSPMAVPRLEKVVINTGLGEKLTDETSDKKQEILDYTTKEIGLIAGQKPVVTKARKSISGFNLRKGDPTGVKVTLRRERMHNFLEKLVNVVLPGIRDFQGIEPDRVDEGGNLTLGIEEHIVFPEIPADERDDLFSLQVTIVTTASDKEEGLELLRRLGFPFKKEENN